MHYPTKSNKAAVVRIKDESQLTLAKYNLINCSKMAQPNQ